MPRELSAAIFKVAVIDARHPVLVSFYADGCGPCQMQAPIGPLLANPVVGLGLFERRQSPKLGRSG